ncbi:MAG: glutaredoxin family protein [bacterium]|nr:glutaredoxin family protein [bacterium]MDN5835571.1 glutaredoxin family protein [bacterium]
MSSAKDIIVYSTTWCAFCKTEKQYLDKLGYSYTEKDIEADKEAYDELMEKIGGNFQGVPVTDVKGQMILGFNRPQLDEALKASGLEPAKA